MIRRPHRAGVHESPTNQAVYDSATRGERAADRTTAAFGSWQFIAIQTALIVVWIAYNMLVATGALQFDPYPFILLNLFFSTQAAYAAPLILLSQNRSAERDRVHAEASYAEGREVHRLVEGQQTILTAIHAATVGRGDGPPPV